MSYPVLEREVHEVHEEIKTFLALTDRITAMEERLAELETVEPRREPAKEEGGDRMVYRIAVSALGLTMIAVVAGVFLLASIWGTSGTVPESMIAIGTAAVAALAGLMSFPAMRK